jgi:hypothetical protein
MKLSEVKNIKTWHSNKSTLLFLIWYHSINPIVKTLEPLVVSQ